MELLEKDVKTGIINVLCYVLEGREKYKQYDKENRKYF